MMVEMTCLDTYLGSQVQSKLQPPFFMYVHTGSKYSYDACNVPRTTKKPFGQDGWMASW